VTQLKQFLKLFTENEDALVRAVKEDFRKVSLCFIY